MIPFCTTMSARSPVLRPAADAAAPTVAWFAIGAAVRPAITRAIAVGDCVRRALVAHSAGHPTFLGRTDGQPNTGHGHAFFLPADDDVADRDFDAGLLGRLGCPVSRVSGIFLRLFAALIPVLGILGRWTGGGGLKRPLAQSQAHGSGRLRHHRLCDLGRRRGRRRRGGCGSRSRRGRFFSGGGESERGEDNGGRRQVRAHVQSFHSRLRPQWGIPKPDDRLLARCRAAIKA